MKTETLIKMANQIGDFFEPHPNVEQAKRDIAEHLNRFWTLEMRQQIARYIAEKQGINLHAKVISAITAHVQT